MTPFFVALTITIAIICLILLPALLMTTDINSLSSIFPLVAGGIAAIPAELLTTPIEIAKIRIQCRSSSDSDGILGTIMSVFRNEGWAALFKGFAPALSRQVIYQSMKMILYIPFLSIIVYLLPLNSPDGQTEPSMIHLIIAGGAAGAIGAWATNPLDVVKVRSQADNKGSLHTVSDMLTALSALYSSGGVGTLWAGAFPSVQRAFLVNAAELATYNSSKSYVMANANWSASDIVPQFVASLLSGLVAALATSPIDRAKTLLMTQQSIGLDGGKRGLRDLLREMLLTQGIGGLYRGFFATWLRLAPWNLLFFLTFEMVSHWLASL
jgi:hypothetical protein